MSFLSAAVRSAPRGPLRGQARKVHADRRHRNKNGTSDCADAGRQGEPDHGPNAGDQLRSWSGLGCENGGLSVENLPFSVPESG